MTDRSNGSGRTATDGASLGVPGAAPAATPAPPLAPAAPPLPPSRGDRAGGEPGELITGLSPRQIIGGFALLAGLIVMLRRRSRRGR